MVPEFLRCQVVFNFLLLFNFIINFYFILILFRIEAVNCDLFLSQAKETFLF